MKLKALRLIVQIALSLLFFLPMMHQRNLDEISLTGFQAVIQGDYFVIGNIVIALVILGILIHLGFIVYEMLRFENYKKIESKVNILVNLTVFFSLIIITFLGTFLELFGYMVVALIILSTYLRYLEQKKNE